MGNKFTRKAYDTTNHHFSDIRSLNGKIVLSFLLLLILAKGGFAQIAVTQNTNTQSLAQLLAGTGVTISNYTKTCDNNGTGTFTANNTNLGITQGVVLASGRVQNIPQAANNFASTQFANSADPQLSNLTVGTIYDKCILEFDIVPQGTDLRFEYVFASEEYPEFVCSPYNDVFGFFISGPDPAGGNYTSKNIATLPGSTTPVFINSVNTGISGTYSGTTWNSANCISLSNTNYYINNLNPVNQTIVYDGMTVVLPASAKVIPCQTYHLKLAIADVGDRIYDSGVFLKAYSFTSAAVTVAASAQLDYAGFTSAYEGCVGGTFTINTSTAQSVDDTIDIAVTGTALNGADYIAIPQQVIIPAGQTSVTIPLTPLADGIAEPGETVTVTVLNPCTGLPVSSATLTIEDNIPISVTVSDSLLCMGQPATLTATGGLAYNWAPAATLSSTNTNVTTATPLTNTNYTVTVSFGGCTQTLSQMLYVSNPSVSLAAPAISCSGNPATITSVVSGAALPVSYAWSNGASAAFTTVTTSGTYILTVTDAHGCNASASASVSASNLSIGSSVTPVSCFGGTNGSAAVSVTGGTSPYTYNWSNGANTAAISNRPAGIYNVTVADAGGCTATALVNISQPTAALTSVLASSPVNCFGGNSGSITINTTGGTAPYVYQWSNNSTAQNLQNIAAGNYIVTITDAKNCSVTAQAVVTQPTDALNIAAAPVNVACYGTNSGSVTIQVTGGTTPYTYLWNTGSNVPNLTGINAGNYNLTVTDTKGCSAVKSVNISQPSAALSVLLATNTVACYGTATGSVTANVSGGVSPYSLVWNNNATGSTITNLSAGNYAITVTDANLCTALANTNVTQPAAALTAGTVVNPVSCFGGNSGSVTINTTGGTTPYIYQWSNNSTTQSLQNLAAGSYTVTITDAKNCSATALAVVTQPAAPVYVALTSDSVSCYGGNNGGATASVIGGTMPYSFVWSNNQTSQNLTTVVGGSYGVTVTDSKNCQATATVYVAQPPVPLQVTAAKTDAGCYGSHDGAATLAATGGTPPYFFEWNNNSSQQNQAGLAAGTYSATTTDVNGCSVVNSVAINQPAPLLVNATANNVLCHNSATGSAQVAVSGGTPGYTFSWSNGKATQSVAGITAGIYTVTVSDNLQCSVSALVSVSQPSAAINAAALVTNVSCNSATDGALLLNVSGGTSPYTYQWSNGAVTQQVQNLSAGSYDVTITDANACSLILSATVTEPAALNVAEAHTAVKCYGQNNGTAQLNVSGGTTPYSYQWNNGNTVSASQNLSAGSYSVTVYDARQCTATGSFTITQPQPLNSVLTVNHALCYGAANGSIQSAVNGGTAPYSYAWSNNTSMQHLQNAAAGNYTLTVTDANGCSVVSNKTIQQPVAISVTESNISPLCFGSANGSIDLTVAGGTPAYTYNWSNGATTPHAANIPAGVYTVTVTDANNCTVSKSVNVTQPAAVVLHEWHSNLSCNNWANGSIQVSATGGTPAYQYFWSNGSYGNQLNNLTAGVYGVTVVDAHGCGAAVSSIVVTEPDSLNIALTATHVKCSETATGAVVSAVTGGTLPYNYHWSSNSGTADIQNIEAGVYTLTVTDANGCMQVSSAMVNDVPPLVVNAIADSVPCAAAKGDIILWADGGVAPYSFLWSNGAVTGTLQQATAGVYYVTVSDANGCELDTALEIENTHQFSVDATGGGTVTLGQTVQLQAVSTGSLQVSYQWIPATGVVCAGCANTAALPVTYTVYTVLASDTNGCTAQDTVSADVIEDYTVFTPNAFTPNGDGNNDYFQFYGNAAGLKYINIMIFDRWGEKLYEADEPTFKWDGMYKGELVPPGVYVYVMKLVFINGHADEIHKGSLTVIR